MARSRSGTENRGGYATVEFALVMSVLLPLMLGLWEIGRYAMVQNVLDTASQMGGRLAVSGGFFSSSNTNDPTTGSMIQGTYSTDSSGNAITYDIQKRVLTYLSATGMTTTGVTVLVENVDQSWSGTWPAAANTGKYDPAAAADQLDHVRVTVTMPSSSVQWSTLGLFVSNSATLTAVSDWYSMHNVPITVSTTIPQQVQ